MVEAFRRVLADVDDVGARYALVGGFAVAVRAEPRFTRDVDIAVSVADDGEAEAVVRALRGRGYETIAAVEQTATGRLATVRLRPPPDRDVGTLDLLFASSGIEAEVVAAASRETLLPGLVVPVATAPHLVAMKILSFDDDRPQDRVDLRALLTSMSADELAEARRAVALITARGFHRGRDLAALLDDAGRQYRPGSA